MKFSVASDVHLEFGNLDLRNKDKADVLILAGDILVAKHLLPNEVEETMEFKFLSQVSQEFEHVIYIMGNHEHYGFDFAKTHSRISNITSKFTNINFLEKSHIEIGDTMFVGATMWTDVNKNDPLTKHILENAMNDYRTITNSNHEVSYKSVTKDEEGNDQTKFNTRPGKFSTTDSYEDYTRAVEYFTDILKTHNKVVMVTHHAPSRLSVHPKYYKQEHLNHGYCSSMELFILDHPQIKYWVHGHTHEQFDYEIGDTRVICNPRGYIGYEQQASHFELKTFEV